MELTDFGACFIQSPTRKKTVIRLVSSPNIIWQIIMCAVKLDWIQLYLQMNNRLCFHVKDFLFGTTAPAIIFLYEHEH